MIIRDFYLVGITVAKEEADTPLIVNRYGILAFSVVAEFVETIARWHTQVVQTDSQLQVFQFPPLIPIWLVLIFHWYEKYVPIAGRL